jgi:bifunctional non-homologous end joining protein LigD
VGYVNDPNGPPLRLETTRGLDATVRFPELAGLPPALAPHAAVVDGELVAFDERGRPSFGRIQDRIHVSDARAAARGGLLRTRSRTWSLTCCTSTATT